MRRIVVDMQNALFTDAIAAALRNFDSDFEVFESELPQKTAELCGDVRADVLIAEVTSCTPWTFEDRMKTRSELKKICPELDSLNIGGGFPIKNSLGFNYDYEYMTEEIVAQIKNICNLAEVEEPNLFTEFGSFTVGESGATLFSIINQKQQNDRESWYMIDSSFMTTLPDIWGINQRYILLAINNWDKEYQRVFLGGLTCDSEDYYNGESHSNAIFLPKLNGGPQYIGFFHTGAYQESLGGFGGIQHCLIPAPKHIIIDREKGDNEYYTRLFAKEQSYRSMMRILGY